MTGRRRLGAFLTVATAGLEMPGSNSAAEAPREKQYHNLIGMKLVRVKPGPFIMGADEWALLCAKFRA
jgi:hypothetical protein